MRTPRLTQVDQSDAHRLIASKYRPGGESVLVGIADDDAHLRATFELEGATNERLLAEADRLPGIGVDELVFGVPHYRVINAAFCHAHPEGGRFNGPDRGAWYASFGLETAKAEVIFHKTVALAEIDCFEDQVTYDDYLADFHAEFHDLRADPDVEGCLRPDSYLESQALAADLLAKDAVGIVYPSARDADGTNLVCLRPALVGNVRLRSTWRFTWEGGARPSVALATAR